MPLSACTVSFPFEPSDRLVGLRTSSVSVTSVAAARALAPVASPCAVVAAICRLCCLGWRIAPATRSRSPAALMLYDWKPPCSKKPVASVSPDVPLAAPVAVICTTSLVDRLSVPPLPKP